MSHHNENGSSGNGNGRHIRHDGRGVAQSRSDPESASFFGSGRLLVTAIVVAVLLLWGGLNLVFRQWRAAYRERAAYGAAVVAGAIDPLAEVVPEGEASPIAMAANSAGVAAAIAGNATPEIHPDAWRKAIEQTHAMLVTLTAANLIGRDQMTELGTSVSERVERAKRHPETARMELSRLWDEISDRAGIIIDARHPRPAILPPKAKKKATPAAR